jgi:hypothetical protein
MGAFLDCIFPTEEKPAAKQVAALQAREGEQLKEVEDSAVPDKFAEAYDKLLEDENERLKSVESRLSSMLGLTSITATLLVSGTMALVNGSLGDSSRTVRVLAALGALYLSLQIICSTLAAVHGLARSIWLRPGVVDLVHAPQSDQASFDRERAIGACKRYQVTDRNVNFKVTKMAVAHTAIRNFAVGSVTIAVLGFFAVLLQAPENATAKAIRKDADLQRPLCGPQGPAGPPGPPAVAAPAQKIAHHKDDSVVADGGRVKLKTADAKRDQESR